MNDKRTSDDRRNELRRAEARRQADLRGEDDFLCNDFDTPQSITTNVFPIRSEGAGIRYGLIVVAALLLVLLGVVIDRAMKGL